MEIQFTRSKDLSLGSRLDANSVKGWPEVSLSILKAWIRSVLTWGMAEFQALMLRSQHQSPAPRMDPSFDRRCVAQFEAHRCCAR